MSVTRTRPISPHLGIYRRGPHMIVSIMHRIMGAGLGTVGIAMFAWWLTALASGKEAYATFLAWATWPWAWIVPIGLTFAFFLHMGNGIRHFVLDIGAGYELKANRKSAIMVMFAAVVLTALMWTYIFVKGL